MVTDANGAHPKTNDPPTTAPCAIQPTVTYVVPLGRLGLRVHVVVLRAGRVHLVGAGRVQALRRALG
jgi:hypothetical protein